MQLAWSIRMELKLCFVLSEVRWFSKGPLRLLFSFLGPKDSFNSHVPWARGAERKCPWTTSSSLMEWSGSPGRGRGGLPRGPLQLSRPSLACSSILFRSADWDSTRAYFTLAPACRGLERPPTLEPEGPLAIIKFSPFLFKMETLRPREGKQFVSGHTETNGLKLSSLTAFLLLFSFVPSLPPRVLQLIFPKGHFGPAQCPGPWTPCPRTSGLKAIILPLPPKRPPVAPVPPPHISCPCHQLCNPFENPDALIASHINSTRMSGGGVQNFFF